MAFKQNKAQEEAINTIEGPVMIVSCPGSGKTTTLVRRIRHMVESGVDPTSILMVTFSRAAATEMKDKYEKLFGENPGISFQTIHSLCFNLLIKEEKHTRADILLEREKNDFLVESLRYYPEADGDIWEMSRNVATAITAAKNNYSDVNEYEPDGCNKELFLAMYHKYEGWKKTLHKIDFDDMLIECRDMLENEPSILNKWADHFKYIQCDEYQDTNTIQKDILYMLSGKTKNLCVVGDDDQSIYRFRGARPEIMLHFMDDFPDAKKIMMGINYRSAGEIVEKAGKLIVKNKTRYGKTFVSQRGKDGENGYTEYLRVGNKQDEMDKLPQLIEDIHKEGVPYNQMAVLFRVNTQAVLPVSALSAAKIPFNAIESVRCIYDGWIFNDIRTYVDLACGNYKNEDELRQKIKTVLNRPNRYFNPSWFENVSYDISGFRKALYPISKDAMWKYSQALEQADTWMRLFGPGKLSMDDSPELVFKRLTGKNTIRYEKHISDMAKFRRTDSDEYFEVFDEIIEEALRFQTIRDWFAHADWMSRFIQEESRKKNPEGVVLATMHQSKGLEWHTVFIIDCNDGVIPHKNSSDTLQGIEEERRLFYVAMTRAKDNLYVINSNRAESSFIKESELITKQERKLKEEIPKYLPGKKIRHKSFGEGKLVSYGPANVTVDFGPRGRKSFQFPASFKDGLLEYI